MRSTSIAPPDKLNLKKFSPSTARCRRSCMPHSGTSAGSTARSRSRRKGKRGEVRALPRSRALASLCAFPNFLERSQLPTLIELSCLWRLWEPARDTPYHVIHCLLSSGTGLLLVYYRLLYSARYALHCRKERL